MTDDTAQKIAAEMTSSAMAECKETTREDTTWEL
jgi:hypothetical protein